jgi:hypothetical protein
MLTRIGEIRIAYRILIFALEPEGRGYLGNIVVYGRIILNWALRK